MSKIFDGLKKTEGAIAKLTIEMVGEDALSSPAPAAPGPAHDSNGGEQQAFHRSTAGAAQRMDSGHPFEAASGSFQALPDEAGPAVSRQAESQHATAFGLEELSYPGLDLAPPARPAEANGEAFPDSRLESAPTDTGSQSVVIRLRAGYPLLPFDTGEADSAAEEYQRIRIKITQHHLQPRLMLISSPSAGDGKSITALNIGGALALNREASVLLVDVDLRHPTIAALLGLPERDGVAEVLNGSCRLEDAIVRLEPFPNLFLLPAGKDRRNPAELLSSPRWKTLCEEFRAQMTYTVFDGPPVDAVAEYSLLQERADGLILVLRTDHTARPLMYRALEAIPKDKLLGSVINGHRESFFWKQRSEYYS
jgi:capsular exopolysaccharide synthesis family protein